MSWGRLTFFISKIKDCIEWDKIVGCFIDQTDCDERIKGSTGRSGLSGIRFVVPKWVGAVLSDGIKNWFYLIVRSYGHRSGT
jgi:hypothetical protein